MFLPHESWTRREFLKLIGGAGLVGAATNLARTAAAFGSDTVCVSILHTTDLHGHILPDSDYDGNPDRGGLARCATQIQRWRRQNRNSILIDAGDVYQGTNVSWRNQGQLMIELLNHLEYDAWVIGNHEFDWGIDAFHDALAKSAMPVLAANTLLEGKSAGEFSDPRNPVAKIQPYILKECEGIRIAIIGVATPGMQFWFRPEFMRGIEFSYPVEPVRRAIAKAKSAGADAVVVAGHMGLKMQTGGDDFANSVMALTAEFPQAAAFIAGHTHQPIQSRMTNGVLLTQADHFGIYAGRVDLFFDRTSKKLLRRRAVCELMDDSITLDPVVISRAKRCLDESEATLAEPIGELAETLGTRFHPGRPSDVERLIGAAIMDALRDRGVAVDAVFHGVFDERSALRAGPKTLRDIWNVIPYENYLVTAELGPDEIKSVMEEAYASHEPRNLVGLNLEVEGNGDDRRITSITLPDGTPLGRVKKCVVAFNTFDSRSGGHRFMKLRELLETPAAKCRLHSLQTRDALIQYFRRYKVVRKLADANQFATAA